MPLGIARWCELLMPWMTQIKCASSYRNGVIFNVDSLELTPAGWRRFFLLAREAAELLHVRALVETCLYEAYADMVIAREEAMCLPAELRMPSAPSVPPWNWLSLRPSEQESVALELQCRAHRLKESDVAMFDAFFFAFDERSVRRTFRRTMQTIYTALTPAERRLVDAPESRIPVQFSFQLRQGETHMPVAAYLRAAVTVVQRVAELARLRLADRHDRTDDDSEWRYRFPFTLARVGVSGIYDCTPRQRGLSAALTELLSLGVRLDDHLDFVSEAWVGRCPIADLGPVLQGVTDAASLRASLGITQVVPATTSELEQSLTVHAAANSMTRLVDPRTREQQLEALFSSLLTARDVDFVKVVVRHLASLPEGGQRMFRWLVYALFSKDSASCLLELDLGMRGPGEDEVDFVDAITSVLAATNPASALLSSPGHTGSQQRRRPTLVSRPTGSRPTTDGDSAGDDEDRDLGFVLVEAGASIRIKPAYEASGLFETFELKQRGRFRVMQDLKDDDDCVDIVVPCFGHCRVARSAIDRIEPDAAPLSSSLSVGYRGSITSLRVGEYGSTSVLPLVCYVGSKLRSLSIGGVTTNDDLREILTSCPSLFYMALAQTEASAETVLLEAYERGRCKLESLHIDAFWGDDDTKSTVFLRVLQDPASAAAKRLQVLTFMDFRGRHAPFSDEFLDALADMLAANWTLSSVRLRASFKPIQPRLLALMATNGRWVSCRPLSASKRYALLSVVQRLGSASTSEPPRKRSRPTQSVNGGAFIRRLDPAVLAIIFAFAAEGAIREVRIEVPSF